MLGRSGGHKCCLQVVPIVTGYMYLQPCAAARYYARHHHLAQAVTRYHSIVWTLRTHHDLTWVMARYFSFTWTLESPHDFARVVIRYCGLAPTLTRHHNCA